MQSRFVLFLSTNETEVDGKTRAAAMRTATTAGSLWQRSGHNNNNITRRNCLFTQTRPDRMKVELSLHASKLKNVAGVGKGTSDPFAVVTQLATVRGEKAKVLGKTEVYVLL